MKEKKRDAEESKITGFFDKDTEIKGDLHFKGTFRVDGRFKGKVDSESVLIIGDSGKVEADIKIGHLIINGEVKGNIQASEKVEVNSNGRIFGTIISPKLIVEEGAYLEATCQTTDKISLEKPAAAVLPEKKQEIEPKP
ncbi:MAG: polymer-forming cytoskeletal protein [Candidatus Aminicenantes bacterium]|nr:MAG: polymer-forming cytoskeletal protein [Candidatus Aminicenantes bacterium]